MGRTPFSKGHIIELNRDATVLRPHEAGLSASSEKVTFRVIEVVDGRRRIVRLPHDPEFEFVLPTRIKAGSVRVPPHRIIRQQWVNISHAQVQMASKKSLHLLVSKYRLGDPRVMREIAIRAAAQVELVLRSLEDKSFPYEYSAKQGQIHRLGLRESQTSRFSIQAGSALSDSDIKQRLSELAVVNQNFVDEVSKAVDRAIDALRLVNKSITYRIVKQHQPVISQDAGAEVLSPESHPFVLLEFVIDDLPEKDEPKLLTSFGFGDWGTVEDGYEDEGQDELEELFSYLTLKMEERRNKTTSSGHPCGWNDGWFVAGRGLGWERLNQHGVVRADDGATLLRAILPKTDCNFRIFEYEKYGHYGFKIYNTHHDAPTGETYFVIPILDKDSDDLLD